jgi:hypothetical protein
MTDTSTAAQTASDSASANAAGPDTEPQEPTGGRSKVAAVAAGTVAGVAGGIAVAARDTRRRVFGVPIGKRSRVQRAADSVVDAAGSVVGRVQEPAKKIGTRFSRERE